MNTTALILAAGGCSLDAALRDPGGCLDAARVLLEAGADPDLCAEPQGGTPLMAAAAMGGAEAVKLLLKWGAAIDTRHARNGSTALHLSCACDHPACAAALLDACCDILIEDQHGMTAVQWAARQGNGDVLLEFQRRTAGEHEVQLVTAAREAAVEQVEQALADGAGANTEALVVLPGDEVLEGGLTSPGREFMGTPLMAVAGHAAGRGAAAAAVVHRLVDAGAPRRGPSFTLVHREFSVKTRKTRSVMDRFPRIGACPNFVIDEDDDAPLTTAAAEGNLEVLRLVGLGRTAASHHRSSTLYTIFTEKFGASIYY
jgi:ankyrin repeat protein